MVIGFNCKECGAEMEAPDGLAGQPEKCPNCGFMNRVPKVTPAKQAPAADRPTALNQGATASRGVGLERSIGVPPNTADDHPMASRLRGKRLGDDPDYLFHCPVCDRTTALEDGFCPCGYIPDEKQCKEILAGKMQIAENRNKPILDDVLGNANAVRWIRTLLDAHLADLAKLDGRTREAKTLRFPHLLLFGTASRDYKKMVAEIVAHEIMRPIKPSSGKPLNSPARVGEVLRSLETGDVLFIDEIISVGPVGLQMIFEAMCYGHLVTVAKAGTPDREETRIKLPPFTLIGSTTHDGRYNLAGLLKKQFKAFVRLDSVTALDLAEAITQRAQRRGLKVDAESAAMIAERAQGSPQLARRILDWSMDAAVAESIDMVDTANVRLTCEILGVESLGHDARSGGGNVYVLINAAMQGQVKVGKTKREPEDRARELSAATGIPTPFAVAYAEWFKDCSAGEDYVHALLEQKGFRVAQNREFFCAPVQAAIQAVMKAKEREDPGE